MGLPDPGHHRSKTMSEKTCAACDYPLDENAIEVRVGGQTVEVCCEDCATKLREAHASATASRQAAARA
jgi:RNase P subunit RPR2